MSNKLANIIRLITSKGEIPFVSSLTEELNNRLEQKMTESYLSVCETLYKNQAASLSEELISENKTPKFQKLIEKPIDELVSSLQESMKDKKTIVHRFLTGESVTISHEDSRCLINLHDSLNKMNQVKMRKLMSENYSEYNKILQFSKKYIERTLK